MKIQGPGPKWDFGAPEGPPPQKHGFPTTINPSKTIDLRLTLAFVRLRTRRRINL